MYTEGRLNVTATELARILTAINGLENTTTTYTPDLANEVNGSTRLFNLLVEHSDDRYIPDDGYAWVHYSHYNQDIEHSEVWVKFKTNVINLKFPKYLTLLPKFGTKVDFRDAIVHYRIEHDIANHSALLEEDKGYKEIIDSIFECKNMTIIPDKYSVIPPNKPYKEFLNEKWETIEEELKNAVRSVVGLLSGVYDVTIFEGYNKDLTKLVYELMHNLDIEINYEVVGHTADDIFQLYDIVGSTSEQITEYIINQVMEAIRTHVSN